MISIPMDHPLPQYQIRYKNYDTFLYFVALHLPRGSTVIDVGANVGDSLAAMASSNDKLHFICVEPEPLFFEYLKKNAELIAASGENMNIELHDVLIANRNEYSGLMRESGTSHGIIKNRDKTAIKSKKIDDILSTDQKNSVSLLKVDVDGFDYDVIESASKTIKKSKPLIYFEATPNSKSQFEKFKNLIILLQKNKYANWTAFDNYGNLILSSTNPETIIELLLYVQLQRRNSEIAPTIWYLDIFCSTSKYEFLHKNILNSYLSDIL